MFVVSPVSGYYVALPIAPPLDSALGRAAPRPPLPVVDDARSTASASPSVASSLSRASTAPVTCAYCKAEGHAARWGQAITCPKLKAKTKREETKRTKATAKPAPSTPTTYPKPTLPKGWEAISNNTGWTKVGKGKAKREKPQEVS